MKIIKVGDIILDHLKIKTLDDVHCKECGNDFEPDLDRVDVEGLKGAQECPICGNESKYLYEIHFENKLKKGGGVDWEILGRK